MRVDESMTFWSGALYTVRVWASEKGLTPGPRQDIVDALELMPETIEDLALLLDGFPQVSAYEILDSNKQGVCVYKDWP